MNCEKCAQFDEETKELMRKVLDQKGMELIIGLLANQILANASAIKKIAKKRNREAMAQKVNYQMQIDYGSALMGNFLMGLDDFNKNKIKETLAEMGMRIEIKHEDCPHE